MDKPQDEKALNVLGEPLLSVSHQTKATNGWSKLFLLAGGAIVLLTLNGNGDGAARPQHERDARLVQEAVNCFELGILAQQAMQFRQAGGSKVDLLDVIYGSGSPETQMLARAIVDDAYNSELHSDPSLKAASILAFRGLVEETCSTSR